MIYNSASRETRIKGIVSISLAVIVPLCAYIITLAPDITWRHQGSDGGDLITAAYTLGVPHPTGYPTYTVVGWFFSHLPVGSVGWRLNLLSALSTAGCAGLIFRLVRLMTGLEMAGLIAAWSFALTPLVWSQAVITEVYGLNLFCLACLIWLGYRVRHGEPRSIFWLGLGFGVTLGTHLTSLFILPMLFGLLYPIRRYRWGEFSLGLLLGLLIFLYLPLRAGFGAISWGEPNTLSGFWELVSGKIYQGYLLDLPLESVGRRLPALAGYLTGIGLPGLILLGVGLWQNYDRLRLPVVGTAVSALGYISYAIGYRTPDAFVLLLPVFVLMALGIGLGVAHVVNDLGNWKQVSIIGLIIGLILIGAVSTGSQLSLRNDKTAQQFWQTVMSQAPAKAVLLTYEDRHTFTLWYAQHVLKQRPDVAIVDTGLLAYDWYHANLQRNYPWLDPIAPLPDLFSQGVSISLPLCAVLGRSSVEGDEDSSWELDCLVEQAE
jgi:4-amino-4-deoxy-L-arabinose transferase-like glycosyltransferase